jgi:sugar phosphate isomerase/epimerase
MTSGGMVWTLGEITDLYKQIAWFADNGFSGVGFHTQPNFGLEWVNFDVRQASTNDRRKFKDALAPFDETAIHGESFTCDILLASPNELIRRASVESVRDTVHLAAEVGVKTVTLHKGIAKAQWALDELRAAFSRTLDELAEMAAGTGVTIAIETEPTLETYYDLLMAAGPGVGVTVDTGHVCLDSGAGYREFGTIGNLIRYLGGKVVHMHVHDYDGKNDHIAIGSGDIDWADIMGALQEIGYQGMLCMEYSPMLTTPEDYIAGRRTLEGYLGR